MKLSDLDHLRDNKMIKFKEEEVLGETVTIVSYMVADNDMWETPLSEECRGITFDSSGTCICRPFHKFFNMNENKYTQLKDIQQYDFEVLEKRDGSMVTPVLINGTVLMKTKKSFFSEVAREANSYKTKDIIYFSRKMINLGYTPIFEYTSPFNRIVINYGEEPKFVLLGIRDINTGGYLNQEQIKHHLKGFDINLINRLKHNINTCIDQIHILEDFEGWVLRDTATGLHVKLKTDWYLRNHRARTMLRERDIADMVIDETVDDIKSALAVDGYDLSKIELIEHKVATEVSEIVEAVQDIIESIEDKTNFKSIAVEYKNHPLFHAIIQTVRGYDFDYKRYWRDNFRLRYSLNCIYSSFNHKQQEEE